MKIGGTTRDTTMTLIPLAVALFVASYLLGGPDQGLRIIEQGAHRTWNAVVVFFRH